MFENVDRCSIAKGAPEKLQELLGTVDTPLELLMESEAFLDEWDLHQKDLLNFMIKEKMSQIIDYVVVEPLDESDRRRAFKLPFVASEFLSSEATIENVLFFGPELRPPESEAEAEKAPQEEARSTEIIQIKEEEEQVKKEEVAKKEFKKLELSCEECNSVLVTKENVEKNALLDKLLGFLHTSSPLNPVLAGYFSKIIGAFFDKRKKELWNYFTHYREHLDRIIDHCDNASIAYLLLRILLSDSEDFPEQPFASQRKDIVLTLLKSKGDFENKLWILSRLVEEDIDLPFFLSSEIISEIYSIACKKNQIAGLKFIISLIDRLLIPTRLSPFCLFGSSSNEKPKEPLEVRACHLIKHTIDSVPIFEKILAKKAEIASKPLGLGNLSIVDWFFAIFRLNDPTLAEAITKTGLARTLLELMHIHYQHSILHSQIHKIFKEALCGTKVFPNLVKAFSINSDVATLLLQMFNKGKSGFKFKTPNKQLHKQYLVFVTSLSSMLKNCADSDEEVLNYLKKVQGWEEYSKGELRVILERQNTPIDRENSKLYSEASLIEKIKESIVPPEESNENLCSDSLKHDSSELPEEGYQAKRIKTGTESLPEIIEIRKNEA